MSHFCLERTRNGNAQAVGHQRRGREKGKGKKPYCSYVCAVLLFDTDLFFKFRETVQFEYKCICNIETLVYISEFQAL